MSNLDTCEACGVPVMISRDLEWESNGVISLAASPRNRMVFFESEPIDSLFRGIEELIGMPIEHIVIESRARDTRRYIERVFPPAVRSILEGKGGRLEGQGLDVSAEERETLLATMRVITQSIIDIAKAYGYGEQRPGELWDQGGDYPWRNQYLRKPYSLLFLAADNLGSVEAFESTDMWVKFREIAREEYVTDVYPAEHPVGLKERLRRKRYDFKPGDIDYRKCPECGIPLEVGRRIWDLDEGTINDPDTHRRMAIFGPAAVDAIFEDLEMELGAVIPATVIEAQRRYIKTTWDTEQWNRSDDTFQRIISVRGLGNLVRFEGDHEHLTLGLENACLHLPMVGVVQALVELAYRIDESEVEWSKTDDGDLNITVSRK